MRRHHPPRYLTDPLAPLPNKIILRRARREARSTYAPLLAELERHTRSGAQNISGISEALAARLAGAQAQEADIYQRARKDALATDQALQGGLAGQAGGISEALKKEVALSGGDPALVAQMQAASAGAVGAQGVRGSAELGALTQRQAAGEEYAGKLPGYARMAGLQGIGELEARAQQQRGDILGHIPGSVAQAIQQARQQEYQKAVAARGFGVDYAKLAQRDRQAQMQEQGRNQRAAATVGVQQQRANETARHNARIEAIDRRGGNQTDARLREAHRHNRVMENIRKRKDRAARKKGSGGGGASGIPSAP